MVESKSTSFHASHVVWHGYPSRWFLSEGRVGLVTFKLRMLKFYEVLKVLYFGISSKCWTLVDMWNNCIFTKHFGIVDGGDYGQPNSRGEHDLRRFPTGCFSKHLGWIHTDMYLYGLKYGHITMFMFRVNGEKSARCHKLHNKSLSLWRWGVGSQWSVTKQVVGLRRQHIDPLRSYGDMGVSD